MRPYIICHMLSSVDGKIDGAALETVTGDGEYEATAAKLNGDAWICGRTTMQQHFAENEPFVSAANRPAGPQPVFVARRATGIQLPLESQSTADPKTRYDKGLAVQKAVFGTMIDEMYERSPKDQLHIRRFLSANCFGDYYTRTGLDIKVRELVRFPSRQKHKFVDKMTSAMLELYPQGSIPL